MFLKSLKNLKNLEVDFWPEEPGLISDLNLLELKRDKIEGLVLDLDNTIIEPGYGKLESKVKSWLEEALKLNFKLVILTNNKNQGYLRQIKENLRVNKLKLEIIEKAKKPDSNKAIQAIRSLGLNLPSDKSKICIIGDQFRTDILLANILEVKSAFVKPLKKERVLIKFLRSLDRFLFYKDKTRRSSK